MSDNLRALPVKLITEESVGLLGALAVAARA
jgi:glucokinase